MRYLFVRVRYDKRVASMEPLGLEYLLAAVKKEGHKGYIFDEGLYSSIGRYRRLSEVIKLKKIDFVGFSVMSSSAEIVLDLIKKLRRDFPELLIMVGGPEVMLNYRDFLLPEIDFVSYDNGIESFRAAVKGNFAPEVMANLPGHAFKWNRTWVVNEKGSPVCGYSLRPDRTLFYRNKDKYKVIAKGTFALAKSTFSCPQKCKFCVSRHFNDCTYAERDPEDFVDELMNLDNDKVFIIDDDFLVNKKRIIKICNLLNERGCDKTFMVFARADSIMKCEDIMPLLYKSGFRDMLVGLEAVEDETLIKYNKNSSVECNRRAIDILRKNNMLCVGLFVVNYDFKHEDFRNINRFIRKEGIIWVLFSILIPFKGTPVYEENKDRLYKYKYRRTDGTHVLMKTTGMSRLMFLLEYNLLYIRNYPRIYLAGLTGKFDRKYKK